MHELRRLMTLCEEIVKHIKSQYAQGEFPLHKNGDRADFKDVWKARVDTKEPIRGLLDGDDLYFWDAFVASHYAIKDNFASGKGIHLMMYPDRLSVIAMWRVERDMPGEEAIAMIENHPRLRAIYGPHPKVTVED